MTQRIFIKVLGFSPAERHALNTLFRLSEQRQTIYSVWEPNAPEAPRLALLDGRSAEAQLQLGSLDRDLKLIWIGSVAPASSWRAFERPLSWRSVIRAMDELFAPLGTVDLDLSLDAPATLPPGSSGWGGLPPLRALVASGDRDKRLYLRARLALADLTQVDEAETGAQALELARTHSYTVAVVDFDLPDLDGWTMLRALQAERPAIGHLVATKESPTLFERVRARMGGASVLLGSPPQPASLRGALDKVVRRRTRQPSIIPLRDPVR
jgi:CheY-like chemotaxis protein